MSGNRGISNKTYRGRIYEFVKAEDEGVYTVVLLIEK